MGRIVTKEEFELNQLLEEEKLTMAGFYQRMSGEVPWKPGEKDGFGQCFDGLSEDIKAIRAKMLIRR